MKDFCRHYNKQAYIICICDKNLKFCKKHAIEHLEISDGQHELVILNRFKDEFCELDSEYNKLDDKNIKKNNESIINKGWSVSKTVKKLEKKYFIFLQGHVGCVNCVVTSYDNRYIISGSSDKTIRI